ncbi:MAG TPA: DUF885 domain-containing protein [Thermoanaerobaculia bacterium]|nr:DUF885 domain-containing protein [Thermoanaerobaculia bacterium]
MTAHSLPQNPHRQPRSGLIPLALLAALALAGCGSDPEVADTTTAARKPTADELHSLFDREWERRLRESPVFATSVGDFRYNAELSTMTPEALEERSRADRAALEELRALEVDDLDDTDRVSYLMFQRQLEDGIAWFELGDWQMPINADSGFHMGFSRLAEEVPLNEPQHYRDYIARLRAWPRLMDEQIANMQAGLERGMTPPRVTLQGYEATIAPLVVEDPTQSVFWSPFDRFPVGVPEAEREGLREEGRRAIAESVVPAYAKFLEFMTAEYIPGARESLAAHELPDGERYYRQQIRSFTTLDLSPDEIHEIGLREVARIRSEMEAIVAEVGFGGSFEQFLQFLRTDPQFYAKTPDDLLAAASYIAKRMDGEMPALFGTLPRLPYTVQPVPDHIAPKYTGGRYVGPAEGSYQPGIYWVNTYALDKRPLYTLPSLTLHEAVPGHHHQGELAREQTGLPHFRRHDYISAFGEGWGLYSEWLGIEAGIYRTPYENFGRLTYEMWRAVRLVVDTGVHAKGWSREQMIDFMAKNTALSLHEVTTETDRYISWPGQALAYKLGELKIRELRQRAEQALGARFDVRAFHDAVLLQGSVPLPVLEEQLARWIEGQRAES